MFRWLQMITSVFLLLVTLGLITISSGRVLNLENDATLVKITIDKETGRIEDKLENHKHLLFYGGKVTVTEKFWKEPIWDE